MNQEVNLFQPLFRRERQPLSALFLFQCLGLIVLGLAVICMASSLQLQYARDELQTVNDQHNAASKRLLALAAQYPAAMPSTTLATELDRVDAELRAAERAANSMHGAGIGSVQGFSEQLAGIARGRIEGTWITGCAIKDGGKTIEISGQALAPEAVTKYIESLARQPGFQGKPFEQLKVTRSGNDSTAVQFLLSTVPRNKETRGG